MGESIGQSARSWGNCPLWSTADPHSSPFPSRTENTIVWKIDALLQQLHLVSLCCAKARAVTASKGPGIKQLVVFSAQCLINQCTRDLDLWLLTQSSGLFGWGRGGRMLICDTSEVTLLEGMLLPMGAGCGCSRCSGNTHCAGEQITVSDTSLASLQLLKTGFISESRTRGTGLEVHWYFILYGYSGPVSPWKESKVCAVFLLWKRSTWRKIFQKQLEGSCCIMLSFPSDFIAFILLQLQKTHLNYETSLAWILYIDETGLTFSGEPECY